MLVNRFYGGNSTEFVGIPLLFVREIAAVSEGKCCFRVRGVIDSEVWRDCFRGVASLLQGAWCRPLFTKNSRPFFRRRYRERATKFAGA